MSPRILVYVGLALLLALPTVFSGQGPPPQANNPFVNVNGDTMQGPLDMASYPLTLNGGDLTSPNGHDLYFDGRFDCFEDDDRPECTGFDWTMFGNAGTDPVTHSIGTTDGADLRIEGGRVGISTSDPLAKLDVNGDTIVQGHLTVDDDAVIGGDLEVGGAGDFFEDVTAFNLRADNDVIAGHRLFADGQSIHVNSDLDDATASLCYGTPDGNCAESFFWNAGGDNFTLTDDLLVQGEITEQSSIQYKDDVRPIDNALAKTIALQGVTYTWKDSGDRQMGLIAENVYPVVPEVVLVDDEGNPEALAYARLVALLIEAIKDLQEQVELLADATGTDLPVSNPGLPLP